MAYPLHYIGRRCGDMPYLVGESTLFPRRHRECRAEGPGATRLEFVRSFASAP